MSLSLVVDMNLSPDWVPTLSVAGYGAVHWSAFGPATTSDVDIMAWAVAHGRTVLTHDLDFGTILAVTNATEPSVVLLRTADTLPDSMGRTVVDAIGRHNDSLVSGALLVIDVRHSRLRLLPFRRP